jgi:hypothetical protein
MVNLKFHVFHCNKNLNINDNFIFVDTETTRINNEEKFKLGWIIFWNKKNDFVERYFFTSKNDFYKYILTKMENLEHLFIFAHNTDFDIKVLGGLTKFIKKGYDVQSFYIEGTRYVVKLKNDKKEIEILDTMNYVPLSLKEIGKSLGLNKMEIDFNKCSFEYLKKYCLNDTEIIFLFIKKLLDFLEQFNLSKLKPTVSSLSLNIFRHNFYNKRKNPIWIHAWNPSILIERLSYKGGITDCFKVGRFKEKQYKLDINSMYPFQMQNNYFPVRLDCYKDITSCKSKTLMNMLNKYFDSHLIIARCKIFLPKKYAYILTKVKLNKEKKSMFLYGTFINTLTSPELEFVKKYGKILEVYNISIYKKSIIFKEFVEFFNTQKIKFEKEKNFAYRLFCKTILNSLYGKFGQTSKTYIPVVNTKYEFSSKRVIDTLNDEEYIQMTLGNKTFEVEENGKNSYDTAVYISSFVTAYARMHLVKLILKAKRENIYYVDTDSIIVNQEGYDNLKDEMDSFELGKLKLEEISYDSVYYRPKFYTFNEVEKCKGVKKNAKKLFEDKDKMIIEQEQFTKFKTSLRKNTFDKQNVIQMIKEIDKNYDKGNILKDGTVEPFNYNEV